MYYGQFQTDKYIDEYFDSDFIGTCFEVGACDGHIGTNTLYFEQKGWKCVCVEPNPNYYDKLKINRKIALNYACGGENKDGQPFTIYELGNNQSAISSLVVDTKLVDIHTHLIKDTFVVNVDIRTLDYILSGLSDINKIDFLSIDTEGTELDVLKGFDIQKWKPKLFVIENNWNDIDIEHYLNDFGYKKDRRIEVNDFYILK